ncbi:MAG: type I-C CRISPR-associated protein Cas8c/Csd1 [Thermodesulfobacteria bacterium]|nr:type I-C CRISPR-associated protein Cas8c/Csd1 [Thermodesulfobacteriota bacterium]
MILQALNSYYQRLLDDPTVDIPTPGSSRENISFALVLAQDGALLDVEDLREQAGKKLRPRKMIVPASFKRSVGVKANFLWDTTSYVLGADDKSKKPKRLQQCSQAFQDQIDEFCSKSDDPGLVAVRAFLSGNQREKVITREDWPEISGSNVVFRLDGVPGFVHDRPAAQDAWAQCRASQEDGQTGQCLIEGSEQPLARLHPSLKGVVGARTGGASLVSFNKKSFESYGKKQSFNAPIGQQATFAYTTALNYLLRPDSRQKIRIGDMTLVFWAERETAAETLLADIFEPPQDDQLESETVNDQTTATKIRDLLHAISKGESVVDIVPGLDPSVHFFLLGISPNAARLSIRFWEYDTLGNLLNRIGKHFSDIRIVRQFDREPKFPPLWRLLLQTAAQGKGENVLPLLAGGMARAMLSGAHYPNNLLPVVLDRIRAEGTVTYFRAALLKGYLIRNTTIQEVSMALDTERTDRSYVLGRLFAVLEKAQEDAIPNTGATIKDKYLASASATPGLVFHMLLKNNAHHLAKLRKDTEKQKWAFGYEKKIQEIMDKLDEFPKTLSAEEQGLFMIGYYHQRKDLFTKKNVEEK